jgi:hypothetical protein
VGFFNLNNFTILLKPCYISRSVSAAILDATYGYKVQDKQDSLVDLAEQVMKDFSGAVEPGAHAVVDTFPWRTYLTIAIQLGRY